jgi:hypothetical protein
MDLVMVRATATDLVMVRATATDLVMVRATATDLVRVTGMDLATGWAGVRQSA